MILLLDTSAFLWLLTNDPKLPESIKALLRAPENEVWLSAVSFWEILVKHRLGKLPLPEPPATYVPRQRARHGVRSLPLQEEAATHLTRLPALHRDPFDRMIVCQAIEHQMSLVGEQCRPDPREAVACRRMAD